MKKLFLFPATFLAFLLCGLSARAQQPTPVGATAPVQASMEAWLGIVDEGQYGNGWETASALFKKAVAQDQWDKVTTARRAPLGKVLSRKMRNISFSKNLPGTPEGSYAVAFFDSSFEHKKAAVETVTSARDPDGVWRVSGYMVK